MRGAACHAHRLGLWDVPPERRLGGKCVRPFQGGVAVHLITRGGGKARGARVASAPGWFV